MGLTNQSTGKSILKDKFEVKVESKDDIVIALAGNPNTGKSTMFNSLTGLNQHTGNWPGKTVTNAQGKYKHNNRNYVLVDLPGTYSLFANSLEEEIARDFICFGEPDATVVIVDATNLERNLNLVLQIMEITDKVIVCVNLIDEACRKNIKIDLNKLEKLLGVPVVGTIARSGKGLEELKDTIEKVSRDEIKTNPKKVNYNETLEKSIKEIQFSIDNLIGNKINSRWVSLRLIDGDKTLLQSIKNYMNIDLHQNELLNKKLKSISVNLQQENIPLKNLRDSIVSSIIKLGENISKEVVVFESENPKKKEYKIDKILTSKIFGIPIMIGRLGLIFWITIKGANYPSN